MDWTVSSQRVAETNDGKLKLFIPRQVYSYVVAMFLSIPEGVSVATVIIDGVDVAPAGVVKRSSCFREPGVRPVDTTIHAP